MSRLRSYHAGPWFLSCSLERRRSGQIRGGPTAQGRSESPGLIRGRRSESNPTADCGTSAGVLPVTSEGPQQSKWRQAYPSSLQDNQEAGRHDLKGGNSTTSYRKQRTMQPYQRRIKLSDQKCTYENATDGSKEDWQRAKAISWNTRSGHRWEQPIDPSECIRDSRTGSFSRRSLQTIKANRTVIGLRRPCPLINIEQTRSKLRLYHRGLSACESAPCSSANAQYRQTQK